jgi:hypothetical protein
LDADSRLSSQAIYIAEIPAIKKPKIQKNAGQTGKILFEFRTIRAAKRL